MSIWSDWQTLDVVPVDDGDTSLAGESGSTIGDADEDMSIDEVDRGEKPASG